MGNSNPQLGRQVHLPLTRAFLISVKNIRMRLGRSLITAAGIFLGIAFLVSVLAQSLVQWPLPVTDIRPGHVRLIGEFESLGDLEIWRKVSRDEAIAAGIQTSVVDDLARGESEISLTSLAVRINRLKKAQAELPEAKAAVVAYQELPKSLLEKPDGEAIRVAELKMWGLPEKEAKAVAPTGAVTVADLKVAAEKAVVRVKEIESIIARLDDYERVPAAAFEKLQREKSVTLADVLSGGGKPTAGADITKVMIVNQGRKLRVDASEMTSVADIKLVSGDVVFIPDAASGNRSIWLAIMALLVCTIGITNSMLMSVTERFREIGTMKCLGALDMFVVQLFIFESGLLGIIASTAGALVGLISILLMAISNKGFAIIAQVNILEAFLLILAGVGVGCLVTMIATIAPAIRAAQMPPAAALRTEV